ncbi:glycosyl hydrolase 115 family protein [uncultured Draconibacterium sp.]|uniref:glycosyl hydrolase 115 family protein n=1 Tax=uncultured Draconibacterium sp. TaxID=1573823 RepID=UPI0025EA908F|nr:glycosyl hydrolase 115 family protein [uncultured Draconibacterium sp.]
MGNRKKSISCFTWILVGLNVLLAFQAEAQAKSGLSQNMIVEASKSDSDFPIVANSLAASIYYDQNDYQGVIRAIGDLQNDIDRVTGVKPELFTDSKKGADYEIIIGTVGKSGPIDKLVSSGKLDVSEVTGKWESFVIATIDQPNKDVKKALVIAGSDKRGTIYGIYELSQQLGVSPWYWWADVPVLKRSSAYLLAGRYVSGEPKVKYRGIFINDENPCMQRWANEKFGGMNSEMYSHMFELLLRLKANLLWPGMWGSFKEYKPMVPILKDENGNYLGNSFNEDDPENQRLADEYGIVMGTSHHEPMQRSQQEWIRNKNKYGNGEWNYMSNKEGIQQFFRDGIENAKNYESLVTMGMRGDEDKPMVDAGSAEANFSILEGIMKDQRRIIEEVTGKPASEMPQVWTLYKEVLDYYDKGMKVPDDMIIMLCDDNWGDVRRLPELNSKMHPGGYGMYYHVGYYGAPRANKWLNVTQIQQMWEQLQLTYDYGVNKIWILNVGDLKPNEYPMDFFLRMAWNPETFTVDNLETYSHEFCAQQFGEAQADEAARILNTYCKYAGRVTPEMLDDKTYNLESGEFKMVKDEFLALEARALRLYLTLPERYNDVYKQLVLFPVQALANLYDMYYAVAMNKKLAAEQDLTANQWADHVEYCFKRDSLLSADYNHNMANGKWNHMMDQVHIGYTTWHAPQFNIMPEVVRVSADEAQKGGYVFEEKNGVVAIEAEHYFECKNSSSTQWTVIPVIGRTLSGMALMPYTEQTDGASISYKMKLNTRPDSIQVRFFFDSTMPFKDGGHRVAASFDSEAEKVWSINEELTWKNNYSKMYPTAAARVIESLVSLPLSKNADGMQVLKIRPLDPGIVLYKVVVDNGGYEETFLKMTESPYKR